MRSNRFTVSLSYWVAPALGLTLGLGTRDAVPGGHEVFCVGTTEVHELWPSIPAGGVPWKIASGPLGTQMCVGFPPAGRDTFLPLAQRPVVQSMSRAASAWRNVKVPFPQMPGAPPPVLPVPVPNASTFKMAATPAGFVSWPSFTQNDADRMVQDGTNLVTCWQPDSWWQNFGGPSALAVTFVHVAGGSSGDIVEGDIAVNVRTEANAATGQPAWSHVEHNDHYDLNYASHIFDRVQPYVDPLLGYADLQGVMTHQFGFIAGLATSLVDSHQEGATCSFPTMFPNAQVEPYSAIHNFWVSSTQPDLQVQTDASLTAWGGMLGKSARSLELDDIAAIGDAYPTAAFTTYLGTITGTCFLNSTATPRSAVHVVAFCADMPELRVGAISYGGGVYTLHGLPPGNYYVYAEPVDQSPPPFALGTGFYFDGFVVPNFVFQGPSGCITSQPFFLTEFWDSAESFTETQPSRATPISVAAGQTVSGIDFDLQTSSAPDILRIRQQHVPALRASPRGVIVSPQGGAFPTIECLVQAPASFAGAAVALTFSPNRSVTTFAGQVILPSSTGATTFNGVLDATGATTFSFPTSAVPVQTNYFAQAVILGAGSLVSNNVNLWMASH